MLEDMDTLRLAQECAREIISEDYNLDLEKNKALCNSINNMFREMNY